LPKLNALYDDLFKGGKGFRAKLIGLMSDHIKLEFKARHLLSQTIEFIHNASLLHDDLIDRSHLRRGKTTAWLKFTPEYAVLAGDYLLARVMVNLSSYGNIKLVQYTAQVISDLLEGEWIQDSLVKDFNVTMNQLDRVHNLKTASLFKWCLRSPFIASERYSEQLHLSLEEMGTLLGMLFQRSDDLLDFDVRNDEGKALLGDLKSGYLNSFATFLFSDVDFDTKSKGIKSESLGQLKSIVGEKYFQKRVDSFDTINTELIARYHHHLGLVQDQLQQEEIALIAQLGKLPDLLYWRNSSAKPKAN
jgi:octaprenyl-diphosphate synthase